MVPISLLTSITDTMAGPFFNSRSKTSKGLAGMPRRYPDYALQFADWNMVSSVGAFLFGVSQILFLFIVVKTVMGGKKATDQVWEGARGLEWTVASPAPYHTFTTPPKVD